MEDDVHYDYDTMEIKGYGDPYEYFTRRCKWNPFRYEVCKKHKWVVNSEVHVVRSNLTKLGAAGFYKLLTEV